MHLNDMKEEKIKEFLAAGIPDNIWLQLTNKNKKKSTFRLNYPLPQNDNRHSIFKWFSIDTKHPKTKHLTPIVEIFESWHIVSHVIPSLPTTE